MPQTFCKSFGLRVVRFRIGLKQIVPTAKRGRCLKVVRFRIGLKQPLQPLKVSHSLRVVRFRIGLKPLNHLRHMEASLRVVRFRIIIVGNDVSWSHVAVPKPACRRVAETKVARGGW